MLEFAWNTSVLEEWQRSPLMLSTIMPFCTSCACALFAKPHFACPVQICVLCPIYCCSMHLARHAWASSWHTVQEHASSWLFGSLVASCIKIMAQSCAPWLNAVHPRLIAWCASGISMAQCCAPGINHDGSMLCIGHQLCLNPVHHASIWLNAVHQASVWLCIMHQYG